LARRRFLGANAIFLALSTLGIVVGAVLRWVADDPEAADLVWAATTVLGLVPIAWEVARGIWRREAGVDLIAVLAMVGSLALQEYLAGAVIAFMLSTGRSLEDFADARAHAELSALLSRAPRTAHRVVEGGLESIPIEDVVVGDLLLVKQGEVIPVDGILESAAGVLDESALTGESRPVERTQGEQLRSGAVNAGADSPGSSGVSRGTPSTVTSPTVDGPVPPPSWPPMRTTTKTTTTAMSATPPSTTLSVRRRSDRRSACRFASARARWRSCLLCCSGFPFVICDLRSVRGLAPGAHAGKWWTCSGGSSSAGWKPRIRP